jgi:hypothetical protein
MSLFLLLIDVVGLLKRKKEIRGRRVEKPERKIRKEESKDDMIQYETILHKM